VKRDSDGKRKVINRRDPEKTPHIENDPCAWLIPRFLLLAQSEV
jgi:hypothetical protein